MIFVLYGNKVSLVFVLSIAFYTLFVLVLFAVIKCVKPDWFANTSDNEVDGLEFGSFADLSFMYTCCPFNALSWRHCCRRMTPKTHFSLKHLANCECIRPLIQGNSSHNIDFVCCRV